MRSEGLASSKECNLTRENSLPIPVSWPLNSRVPRDQASPVTLTHCTSLVLKAQRPVVLITLRLLGIFPAKFSQLPGYCNLERISSEVTLGHAPKNMPTAFSHFLQQVPEELQDVLREDSIGGHPIDAAIFLDLLEYPSIVEDWKYRVMEALSVKDREAMLANDGLGRALTKLKYGAKATPCWIGLSELQQFLFNSEFHEVKNQPLEQGPDFTAWSPRGNLGEPPTTQRRIELNLKDKFTFVIVGILVPYAMSIPYMVKHIEKADRWTIWKRLVGKSRFSTLKNVARMLRKLISLMPQFIPPSEDSVRTLLCVMNNLKLTPNVIMSYWQIIVWIAKKFGTYDPSTAPDLVNERDHIREAMVTVLLHSDKRALALTMAAAKALEDQACDAPLPTDRAAASTFRFTAGSSGRFNDIQHAPPCSFVGSANTMEMMAYQTKVSDNLDKKRPMPLIAVKHSFTGKPWWEAMEGMMKARQKSEAGMLEDYCLPAPASKHQGFMATPCTGYTALRWLRRLLQQGGIPVADAMKITLPSLRVFMPDLAYQANISADRRRYLGRWADENMANTYTREHRVVVSQIWPDVVSWLGENQPDNKMVPENITASHYNLHPPIPAATNGAENGEEGSEAVVELVEAVDETFTMGGKTPFTEATADEGGPLELVMNNKKSGVGTLRKYKVHLLKGDGECVGCAWRPQNHQWHSVKVGDVDLVDHVLCRFCFKHFGLPFPVQSCLANEPSDGEMDSEDEVSAASTESDHEATD